MARRNVKGAVLSQSFDIARLGQLLLRQDRAGYYTYLAEQGSIYAPLALGVVRRDTPSGTIAVAYCREFARRRAVQITDADLLRINLGLMERDYQARTALPGPGFRELPMSTIRAYHADVFRTLFNLPPETWTAEIPLQCAGTMREETVWHRMLSENFIKVGLEAVVGVIEAMPPALRVPATICFASSNYPERDLGQRVRDRSYRAIWGEELYLDAIGARDLQRMGLTRLQHNAVEYLDVISCSGSLVPGAIAEALARKAFQ